MLAKRVLATRASSDFEVVASRTGLPIPVMIKSGKRVHLNSRYDPQREAERLVDQGKESRAYLLLGLEGGYVAKTLLHRPIGRPIELVVMVVRSLSFLRLLLTHVNLSSILSDPRLRLVVGKEPAAAAEDLLASYIPYLHGDLTVLSLGQEDSYNRQFRGLCTESLKQAAGDITTQKAFGRLWMRNITHNVSQIAPWETSLHDDLGKVSGKKIHVTAAGPSLESSLSYLAGRLENEIIVATDTSLPSLTAAGLTPDYVVSVDCQNHSYHHFLSGVPDATALVLDLSSPTFLYRIPRRIIPVAGGHPFARLLAAEYYPFLQIDTSGGNVTQAAVSFSIRLDACEVILHGADFSYPRGKLYARGTYLYPLYRALQNRTHTLPSLFARMYLDRKDVSTVRDPDDSIRYRTALLTSYRAHFERYTRTLSTQVTSAQNPYTPRTDVSPASSQTKPGLLGSVYQAEVSWMEFCRALLSRIDGIELPELPLNTILAKLHPADRNIVTAMMPLAAYHYDKKASVPPWQLLQTAMAEAQLILSRSIESVSQPT